MRRASLIALGAVAVALVGIVAGAGASTSPREQARTLLQSRLGAVLKEAGRTGASTPAAGRKTREIGSAPTRPINGDVWVKGDFAYVGSWQEPCDGLGVKILDVSDPAAPVQVATAAGYPATSAEDMEVVSVDTPSFTGDLLGVGIQACGEGGRSGLALWDVTDPANPAELGFFENLGVHELSLTVRADGIFALLAVPFSEAVTTLFFGQPVGDFQLVDVTDPTSPVLTDDWGATKDGGFPSGGPFLPAPFDCDDPICRGADPLVFAHGATPSSDGRTAYVAYWDLGAVVLDISDPSDISYVGRTVYPAASDGDTHSAVPNAAGTLLATTDEDFSPFAGTHVPGDTWGFARLWSLASPASPVSLSEIATPRSLTSSVGGIYSAHNAQFVGSKLYLSWYSDGVRVVDVSNPARPQETAFYRPQPNAGVLFGHPIPLVWGVRVSAGLMYLSDMFFGLYVVTET